MTGLWCVAALVLVHCVHGFSQFEWTNAFGVATNKTAMRERVREMFNFSFSNYMAHAFPLDELDPINCAGRGPDPDPSNFNINDVLGNYSLTLVDALDTLAVMGDRTQFISGINRVIETVSFDRDTNVQVFEATIRVLGGLLSAHLIATNPAYNMTPPDYQGELLALAHDLGTRLLPAFDSPTGMPHPRVNLRHGVLPGWRRDTCPAGAGSLLLEFGVLSRLVGDPVFESVARRATLAVWSRRAAPTGLLGSVIDVSSGDWINPTAGVGAGIDSFFEYLLKAYILFGDGQYWNMFEASYATLQRSLRSQNHPAFLNVNMFTGHVANAWVDSLQAYFPAVQVLAGDVAGAAQLHAYFQQIWTAYGALPERFNWQQQVPEIAVYPLRPELAEATYLLYRATRDPHYLTVGAAIVADLEAHARVACGFATLHDVTTKSKEDRMESFFLSETLKYLYLLFDEDNILHTRLHNHIFTTQAHLLPLLPEFHDPSETHEALPLVTRSCPRVAPPQPRLEKTP
eukprot:m.41922 g.41922  ORF g.41922 m.41922 type:complete len:515 (-) comp5693_c0_seq1:254-1798(-)